MTTGGTGTVAVGGANTFAASSNMDSGTLVIGNAAACGGCHQHIDHHRRHNSGAVPGGITFANPIALAMATGNAAGAGENYLPFVQQAVTFSGPNPLTLSGVISGNGGIFMNSPATLTITGATANTYIGNTTVTGGGSLLFAKTAAVNGLAGQLIIQGGTVSQSTNFNQLNSQNVIINGNVTNNGSPSVLALGGNSATINALTFIDGGSVTMTSATLTVNNCVQSFSTNTSGSVALATSALISGGTLAIQPTGGGSKIVTVASSNPNGAVSGPTQQILFTGPVNGNNGATSGNFTLAFNSGGTNATTGPIAFSTTATALASNIQTALVESVQHRQRQRHGRHQQRHRCQCRPDAPVRQRRQQWHVYPGVWRHFDRKYHFQLCRRDLAVQHSSSAQLAGDHWPGHIRHHVERVQRIRGNTFDCVRCGQREHRFPKRPGRATGDGDFGIRYSCGRQRLPGSP